MSRSDYGFGRKSIKPLFLRSAIYGRRDLTQCPAMARGKNILAWKKSGKLYILETAWENVRLSQSQALLRSCRALIDQAEFYL